MKHKNFFKTVFTLLLCGSISMASAADIYLASSGSDTNDGLSAGTAVKTLSKAFTIAQAGDVIHVMDMINISDEPKKPSSARADIDISGLNTEKVYTVNGVTYTTWNAANGTLGIIPHTRSVTLIGDDKATCGFDGNNASCIIRQDHSALGADNGGVGVPGMTVITYKNLTFKNGKSNDSSGGGGVYIRGGFPTVFSTGNFENCDFTGNEGKQNADFKAGGGVTLIHGSASFKNCKFSENKAFRGAGIYMQNGTVTVDDCLFENQDISEITNSYAGAIFAGTTAANAILNLTVNNSVFINNKVATNAGVFSTVETSFSPTSTNVKFTNCAFVGNTAVAGLGGAVFLNNVTAGNTQDISFINSTFYNNKAGATSGGAIAVSSYLVNSKFNMINCTVSGNKVTGATGAGGAGVRFLKGSSAGIRTIKNCILENNTAEDANMTALSDYADLGMEANDDLSSSYNPGTTLIIEKSIIGSCQNADFSTQFPNNKSNYVFELNGSIANSYKAKLGVFDEEKNYFPLLVGSEAIAYGDVSFLTSLTPSVTTDQIGRNRPATNCSAGAYEFETISGVKTTVNNSIAVYRNANNQLTVKNDEEVISAGTITVCNIMGQIIMSTPMTGSITTINKDLTSGVYLVLVNINGNVSTKKIMLN